MDIRAIADEGLAVRVHGSHPHCVMPNAFELGLGWNPLDRLDLIAYDRLCVVGFESALKYVDLFYRPWRLDAFRMTNMAQWRDYYSGPASRQENRHLYRIVKPGRIPARGVWNAAEYGGKFFLAQCNASTAILRIVHALNELGCRRAAQLVAAAAHLGPLRRYAVFREAITILAPDDDALKAFVTTDNLASILRPGTEEALIRLIFNHILVTGKDAAFRTRLAGRSETAAVPASDAHDDWVTTANGVRLNIDRYDARVQPKSRMLDDCAIYVIDRVLLVDLTFVAADSSRRTHSGLSGGAAAGSIALLPAFGQRAKPALEICTKRVSIFMDRLEALLSRHRPTRQLGTLVGTVHRDGAAVAVARTMRKAHRSTHSVPVVGRAFRLMSLTADSVVAVGTRATLQKINRAVRRKANGAATLILRRVRMPWETPHDLKTVNDVRTANCLLAVRDLCKFYQRCAWPGGAPHPLIGHIDNILRQRGWQQQQLQQKIAEVVRLQPRFAEAQIEAAYFSLDKGDRNAAASHFAKAAKGTPSIVLRPDDIPARARAWKELGLLYEQAGSTERAITTFQALLRVRANESLARVHLANLLRSQARYSEALEHYAETLHYDGPTYTLPPLRGALPLAEDPSRF